MKLIRPSKQTLIVGLLLGSIAFGVASMYAVQAYQLEGHSWCDGNVGRYQLDDSGNDSLNRLEGLSLQQAKDQINAGAASWNNAVSQRFNFVFTNDQAIPDDQDRWFAGSTGSAAFAAFTETGQDGIPCLEDVALDFPQTKVSTEADFGPGGDYDLVRVARHELGHWLSLGHDRWPYGSECYEEGYNIHHAQALMHCTYDASYYSQIWPEDAAGARRLYGSPSGSRTDYFYSAFYPSWHGVNNGCSSNPAPCEGWKNDSTEPNNWPEASESQLRMWYGSGAGRTAVWRNVTDSGYAPKENIIWEAMFWDDPPGSPSRGIQMKVWTGCDRDPASASVAVGIKTDQYSNNYFFKNGDQYIQGPSRNTGWHTLRVITSNGRTWGEIDGQVGPEYWSAPQTCSVSLETFPGFTGLYEWDSASAYPIPLLGSSPLILYSIAGEGKIWATDQDGPAPNQWQIVGFNDASWSTTFERTQGGLPAPIDSPNSDWIGRNASFDHADSAHLLYRRNFTLSAGSVTSATLRAGADNFIVGVWINNNPLTVDPNLMDQHQGITVPISVFLPGQTNVIAIEIRNLDPYSGVNELHLNFKLTVSQ